MITAIFSTISFPLLFHLCVWTMFPLRYCLAQQGLEDLPLSVSLRRFSPLSLILSGCTTASPLFAFLPYSCTPPGSFLCRGGGWLSHVDALSLYSMIDSPAPQQHPESRHINKLVFCLPPRQQCRPAGIKFISMLNGYSAALLSTLRLYCCQHIPKTRFR